jgi:hypothetical protein
MTEAGNAAKQRPPRWDSFPLRYVTPRWDAGVRYWPGAVLLTGVAVVFFALSIPLGFTEGPLVTAAVVATYPAVVILARRRRRFVPREVAAPESSIAVRLWVLGWLLIASATALYAISFKLTLESDNAILSLLAFLIWYAPLFSAFICIRRAPAWEQWRSRPRKKGRRVAAER